MITFYGQNLTEQLKKNTKLKSGAKIIFLHKVNKPELYGVAKINSKNKSLEIKENQKNFYLISQ